MGIDVSLQAGDGYQVDFIGDLQGRLYTLLPEEEDPAYPMLTSIDPYGDTVFNSIQMRRFLAEWDYAEARAETESEKALVEAVRRMATRCRDGAPLYLKFIGD